MQREIDVVDQEIEDSAAASCCVSEPLTPEGSRAAAPEQSTPNLAVAAGSDFVGHGAVGWQKPQNLADHQDTSGAPGFRDHFIRLVSRQRHRFLNEDMFPLAHGFERHRLVEVCRKTDIYRVYRRI